MNKPLILPDGYFLQTELISYNFWETSSVLILKEK